MTQWLKKILMTLAALALVACTVSPTTESAGEYLDATTITTKVKASLVDQLGSSGLAINVKTYKDQVQLSGFVDRPMVKKRATSIAAGVAGVRSVRNNLIVKSM